MVTTLDRSQLIAQRDAVGPWGHSYEIAQNLWTLEREQYLNWRVPKFLEIIQETGIDITNSRILDLACLDGLFCVEYGKLGATTYGVDIREDNITRARFGADVNRLKNVTYEVNDVLNISRTQHGVFDIVLCCGLFYHLTAIDCIKLLRIMREVTSGICILDTHISFESHIIEGGYPLGPCMTEYVDDVEYHGRQYLEFDEATPIDVRMAMVSSSVNNYQSFWFTRPSLYEACSQAGFKIDREIFPNPAIPIDQQSRPVFVLTPI
jgi:hypothetical protein